MMKADITFDEALVNVNLMGTDQKQIPFLLNALKKNTVTVSNIEKPLVKIDLFDSEAFFVFSRWKQVSYSYILKVDF